jgi:phospholipase C
LLAVKPAPARLPEAAGTESPIQHVVVIYLENQSFDSVLGYWCNDQHGRCPGGDGMPHRVKLSNGATVTPSISTPAVDRDVHGSRACCW